MPKLTLRNRFHGNSSVMKHVHGVCDHPNNKYRFVDDM